MSSGPALAPSTKNSTLATPTLSLASAVTWTMSLTLAPLLGEVIATVGGVASAGGPPAALKAAMCITQAEAFWVAVAL